MDISKIIIVPKQSKYEYDLHKYGLTHDGLMEKYRDEHVDIEKILSSHKRQKISVAELSECVGKDCVVGRNELNKDIVSRAQLVVALGGDNHFLYVTHFIDDQVVMGVNSDPVKSEGALTYANANEFCKGLIRLAKGDYNVERWTRLEAEINGEKVPVLAAGEFYLGEEKRKPMSRYIIEHDGRNEEQKSSGIIVATGAGSTGWYNSVHWERRRQDGSFSKEAPYARFIVSEVFRGKLSGYTMLNGQLDAGRELVVHSLNDEGILSCDSLEDYSFNRGATAMIRISDKPLNVVRLR